jgi:hypothetical protein
MVLYATDDGRILGEEDVNKLSPLDIEQHGIHMITEWDEWS